MEYADTVNRIRCSKINLGELGGTISCCGIPCTRISAITSSHSSIHYTGNYGLIWKVTRSVDWSSKRKIFPRRVIHNELGHSQISIAKIQRWPHTDIATREPIGFHGIIRSSAAGRNNELSAGRIISYLDGVGSLGRGVSVGIDLNTCLGDSVDTVFRSNITLLKQADTSNRNGCSKINLNTLRITISRCGVPYPISVRPPNRHSSIYYTGMRMMTGRRAGSIDWFSKRNISSRRVIHDDLGQSQPSIAQMNGRPHADIAA